jgi:hypothetical protein
MWKKVYLIALAAFVLLMLVLTYISRDWLGSLTNPRDVAANYTYYSNLSWYFLWLSAAILLALANVILWKTRVIWAFWATLLYFAVFVVAQTFWLDVAFADYQEKYKLVQSPGHLSPLIGAGLLIAAAFVVFFNQFLVLRAHDKMYAKDEPVERLSEVAKSSEETTTQNES